MDQKKENPTQGNNGSKSPVSREDIEALRNDSYEAYDRIFLAWHRPVTHLLFQLTGSAEEAEDISQEVFVSLWEYRKKLDPEIKINTYLYMVAKRSAIDYFRRRRSAGNYFNTREWDEIANTSTDSLVITKEIELLKELALSRMPEFRRRIYMMNEQEGLSGSQIAERLGITKESVYTQLSLARKQLRELIGCMVLFLFNFLN